MNHKKITIKEVIIAILSGIIFAMSVVNLFIITRPLHINRIGLFVQILNIFLVLFVFIKYKKLKTIVIVIILTISFLSFIVPIRKEIERETIDLIKGSTEYEVGYTIFEIFDVYYNIYGIDIIRFSTGTEKVSGYEFDYSIN